MYKRTTEKLSPIEVRITIYPGVTKSIVSWLYGVIPLRWKRSVAILPAPARDGWDDIESMIGSVEAPSDWSVNHDHYLYGTPKHDA